jgi:hypothetical protein
VSPAGRIRSCLPAPDALVGWLEALRLVCCMRMNPFRAGVIPTRPNCSEAPATVLRPVSRKAKSSLKAVCRLAWSEDRRGSPWGFAATANPWISAQKNRGLGLQLCAGIGAGGVRGGWLDMGLRTTPKRTRRILHLEDADKLLRGYAGAMGAAMHSSAVAVPATARP